MQTTDEEEKKNDDDALKEIMSNKTTMIAIVNTHPINAWLHVDLKIDSNARTRLEMQSQLFRRKPKIFVNFSFLRLALFFWCICLSGYVWIYFKEIKKHYFLYTANFLSEFRNRLWNLKRCCPRCGHELLPQIFISRSTIKYVHTFLYCTPIHIVFATLYPASGLLITFIQSFVVCFSASKKNDTFARKQ